MIGRNVDWKISLVIFCSFVILTLLITLGFRINNQGRRIDEYKMSQHSTLNTVEQIITDELKNQMNDLEYVRKHIDHEIMYEGLDRISKSLVDYSNTQKIYDQIRYINEEGHEIVRINYTKEGSVVVSNEFMQDKSEKTYFQESINLQKDSVYISNMDLNSEYGRIEVPFVPVIRLAKKTQVASGIVVLNYRVSRLYNRLMNYVDLADRSLFYFNENGSFVEIQKDNIYLDSLHPEFSANFFEKYDLPMNGEEMNFVAIEEGDLFIKNFSLDKSLNENGGTVDGQIEAGVALLIPNEADGYEYVNDTFSDIFIQNVYANWFLFLLYLLFAYVIGSVVGNIRHQQGFMQRAMAFSSQYKSSGTEDRFLYALCDFLTYEFDIKYVFVDEISKENSEVAKTIAMSVDGDVVENIHYALKGTPCENVYDKHMCTYESNVQDLFPEDHLLVDMNAQCYMGIPLYDSVGKPIGLIAMMGITKMKNRRLMEDVLRVLSIRAAQTLEKYIADQKIRKMSDLRAEIVNAAEDGIIVYDSDSNYIVWNSSAEKWTGKSSEEVRGRKVLDVFPELKDSELYRVIDDAIHGISDPGREYVYTNPDGVEYWFRDKTKPLIIDGEINGAIKTLTNITDYKIKEIELQKALHKAEMASNAKSRFLANMSHELRTPMNGMIGMIELTLMGELEQEERGQLVIARQSAYLLVDILNDILDVSSIEAEKLTLYPSYVDLKEIMQSVISLFMPLAQNKGIEIIGKVDGILPDEVLIDSKRFTQIGVNLLGNAVKFTEHGKIELCIQVLNRNEDDIRLRFSCVDTGIGIDEKNLDRIFERFTQIDESNIRESGGTGLGLTIVKQLVQLMGGTIQCESEEGKGSRFFFELQLPYKEATLEHYENREIVIGDSAKNKMRILIVDDDRVNGKVLMSFLNKEGHNCMLASSGMEAISLYETFRPDVTFMDISMPEMSGIEAMKAIKSIDHYDDNPIIAQTAFAFDEDKEEFIKLGFHGYLRKPIDFDEVRGILGEL